MVIHTLILIALLNPDAKKPPNGEIKLANIPKIIACTWNSEIEIDLPSILYILGLKGLTKKWHYQEMGETINYIQNI